MTLREDGAGEPEDAYVREVRGKAERLSRARRLRGGFWQHVAQVGSLGFVFVLPLVAGAYLGRWLADYTGRPGLAVGVLLIGLLVGGFGSWRLIRQSIAGEEE